MVDVGDEQIHPTILVEIRRIHAHSRTRPYLQRCRPLLLLRQSLRIPLPAVHEKKVRDRVIGDKKIHPPVIINIGGDHAPGFAGIFGDSGCLLTSVNVPSPLL